MAAAFQKKISHKKVDFQFKHLKRKKKKKKKK
jgi:hypothetical protein